MRSTYHILADLPASARNNVLLLQIALV